MSDFTPVVHSYTATQMRMLVNVFMVETANGVVLIDGAIARSSSRAVRQQIDQTIRKPLLGVLLTHGHPDHYMGVAEIMGEQGVDFYALPGAIQQARSRDTEESAGMQAAFGEDFPPQRIFPNRVVQDGDAVVIDGVTFHIHDYGACESDCDGVWFFHDGMREVVFCGDIIYNQMHLFMKDGHALDWLRGLDRLQREFAPDARFYPAHGMPCGKEAIYWAKAYIQMYLGRLGDLLQGRDSLSLEEQNRFVATLRSFLPSDDLIELAQFKLDETIKVLSRLEASAN